MIYAICLVLALVLLLILASLFGKRFWRRGSSFYLSPRFSLPQDSALSRRERTICRYYTESLRPLTELTFGKRKSQPLHTMYMHVRLCDAQSQSYQVDDVVSLYQAIDAASGPIFVIGEPGSGKSILARYLVNRVLTPNDIRLDPGLQSIGKRQADQWIPLFVDPSLAQDYASHSMDSSQPEERFKKWLAGVTFLRSTHPIVSMLFNPMDR